MTKQYWDTVLHLLCRQFPEELARRIYCMTSAPYVDVDVDVQTFAQWNTVLWHTPLYVCSLCQGRESEERRGVKAYGIHTRKKFAKVSRNLYLIPGRTWHCKFVRLIHVPDQFNVLLFDLAYIRFAYYAGKASIDESDVCENCFYNNAVGTQSLYILYHDTSFQISSVFLSAI